eukprot:6192507-Pleurochrysis_carterae.AAC.2
MPRGSPPLRPFGTTMQMYCELGAPNAPLDSAGTGTGQTTTCMAGSLGKAGCDLVGRRTAVGKLATSIALVTVCRTLGDPASGTAGSICSVSPGSESTAGGVPLCEPLFWPFLAARILACEVDKGKAVGVAGSLELEPQFPIEHNLHNTLHWFLYPRSLQLQRIAIALS